MITFFNGRRRGLGGEASEIYAQISISFREHLHIFKGARLGVFLAIALHANEDGWAWPSYGLLARETGYNRDTVRQALAELCSLEINGHRVLLRFQPARDDELQFDDDSSGKRRKLAQKGKRLTNRYLIFPSAAEVEKYEGRGVLHLGNTGGGFGQHPESRDGKSQPRQPWLENPAEPWLENPAEPWLENPTTNQNQTELTPVEPTPTAGGGVVSPPCEVVTSLTSFGVTQSVAQRLAETCTLDQVDAWIDYAETAKSLHDRVAFVVSKLRTGEWPPLLQQDGYRDPIDYGILVQHGYG